MKLWILRPIPDQTPDYWKYYDTAEGFIVSAEDEQQARKLVQNSSQTGDECYTVEVWLDPTITTCIELVPTDEACIIMRDFRAE